MNTSETLKNALKLDSDEEKLSYIARYIGENFSDLEPTDFIDLLTPLTDISRRLYQQNPDLDHLTDYSVALTKLAEYLILDEQTWKATPLLAEATDLLQKQPDTDEYAAWRFDSWCQIGECHYSNQRRQQAKLAFKQALKYAAKANKDTEDCECRLKQLEQPMLRYDPVEDSRKYLEVIDEVEKRLYNELKDEPRHMGFCFRYWSAKRTILKEYGIDWSTPSMMNPKVHFD